jgi:hypothetical protein
MLKIRKAVAIISLVILFFASLSGFVDFARAEPIFSLVNFSGPTEGATYYQDNILINVQVRYSHSFDYSRVTVACYVDNQINNQQDLSIVDSSIIAGDVTLQNLTQGLHKLQVIIACFAVSSVLAFGTEYFNPPDINFKVNLNQGPKLIIEGLNVYQTYNANFNITTSEFNSTVSYSLDGGEKVALKQNMATSTPNGSIYQITTDKLTNGTHLINACATNSYGNTTNQKYFNIGTPINPTPHPKATPISIIGIVVGAAMVVVILALGIITVIYFRQKPTKTKKQQT